MKINREQYAATSDSILNKVKVPYHLLLHGTKNPIELEIYCWEIIHAMKVAETAAVSSAKLGKALANRDEIPNPNSKLLNGEPSFGIA